MMATLNFPWRGSTRHPRIRPPARHDDRRRGQDPARSMRAITTLALGALAGMMMTHVQPAFIMPHATAAALGETRTTAKTSRVPRASLRAPASDLRMRTPEACVPSESTPARPGPIAYV